MKQSLIKKDISSFKIPPNLENYEKIRKSFSWEKAKSQIEYKNNKLNAAYNAIERNAQNWRKNKIALYWIGAENQKEKYTFSELNQLTSKFANLLGKLSVDQGDRVFFFLTRVPALYFGFLGTLKSGAIAGTMFAAFGPQAVEDRLGNSQAKILVTEPDLFERVAKVANKLPYLKTILVTGDPKETAHLKIHGKQVINLFELLNKQTAKYKTKQMDPKDYAFMLYTSGTTGKPKGVLHAHQAIIHEHMSAKYDKSSLRHLPSVGEPLNPEPIRWGIKAFGMPFHDNWWQTETGGILIANYPAMDIKPGSMGKPLPGITASVIDDQGKEVGTNIEGNLAIKPGWPSMMKTIWRRPQKYKTYFKGGWYISGDKAYKDSDGYFWFIGRSDDVIKTSGERVGPFEVESALIEHPKVIEAGVIGKPDPLRGEIIKAFVKLKEGVKPSKKLKDELAQFVKKHLAAHAYPREIEFIDSLPKTRSGKIMRRILKAKELGLPIGDTSTLEEF